MTDLRNIDIQENKRRMDAGELYHAFTPDLVAARTRCSRACKRYSSAGEVPRRRLVELWRDVVGDTTPLPAPAATPEADEDLFANDPWVEGPIHIDYGTNVKLGQNVFVNFNCTILDTCLVTIGSRTLVGPNVSLYSGTHPLDPLLRNGTNGPELGKEIHIGEDCWIGGGVSILPGVTIGRGCTIGAASVVTKSVPDFHVAAGNPARVIRKIETKMDPEQQDAPALGTGSAAGTETEARALASETVDAKSGGDDKAMEERFWRAFAASEKGAAEGGAFEKK